MNEEMNKIQEITSRGNKYIALWDGEHNNGYWIFLKKELPEETTYWDADENQIGFFESKSEEFYLNSNIKNESVNLLELFELTQRCNYQKPELKMQRWQTA